MKRLRYSLIKWLVVALICLLLGFLLGKFKQDILHEQLLETTNGVKALNERNESLQSEVSRLEVEDISQKETIKSLAESNKQLQNELLTANNKLFFYERVIAPELEQPGVKVYSFELNQNELTEEWQYQLVLMQSQKERRFLNGTYTISLSVFEGEILKLVPLSTLMEGATDGFKFKYFQTLEGVFSLPENTTVDEVIVQLNVAGNRWYKAQSIEERYDWRVLTSLDSSEMGEFEIR
ncbi:hypothetical protein CW745_14785 [Psychromonas sp. psych-6C06]|uniref:DUF6776 family protein n=1 Tax=Psychromonas sp. psych-6C06 TaxID=2058089 RepID=UPI000C340A97|nr:DUF6776 family protein [Psychromonas sp. psych-6C06]PKF60473.1 hypothetical protein CW745_14785 [Psychromonas sp. psych-6C06]